MKMTSKSLSDKISKTISCGIGIAALSVVVVQGYSIWTHVNEKVTQERNAVPDSVFSWNTKEASKSKEDGGLQKDGFIGRPTSPISLNESLDEPVLQSVDAASVEAYSKKRIELEAEQADAPKSQDRASANAMNVPAAPSMEIQEIARTRVVDESDSIVLRHDHTVELDYQIGGQSDVPSIPPAIVLQAAQDTATGGAVPSSAEQSRIGERVHSEKPQMSYR